MSRAALIWSTFQLTQPRRQHVMQFHLIFMIIIIISNRIGFHSQTDDQSSIFRWNKNQYIHNRRGFIYFGLWSWQSHAPAENNEIH